MEKRGQQIKDSRFYRDFCQRCGEPLRVAKDQLEEENFCEECDPSPRGNRPANKPHGLWYKEPYRG